VAIHAIQPMPLTGVGKVFKPALRLDAARRVAENLLADAPLAGGVLAISAETHPVHGSLITVRGEGVPQAAREALAKVIQERLGPLTMRHEVVWG